MKGILFVTLVLLYVGCTTDLEEIEKLFEEKNDNIEKVVGVDLMQSDSGNVILHLLADSMVINRSFAEPFEEFPLGVKAVFYNNKQRVVSTLVADYAIRDINSKKVIAKNNVILFNKDGDTLQTDELTWNEKTRKIETTQFVKISNVKGEKIYGFGFEANETFTRYRIRDVSGVTNIPVKNDN